VDTPFGDGETARDRLRFMNARALTSVRAERSSLIDIHLNADCLTEESLGTLHKLLRQYPGPCRTRLRLEIPRRSETVFDLPEEFKVAASEELLASLEQVFGERVAVLR
jgi:hypothetical protein